MAFKRDTTREAAAIVGAGGLFLIAVICVVFIGIAVHKGSGDQPGVAALGAIAMSCVKDGLSALKESEPQHYNRDRSKP